MTRVARRLPCVSEPARVPRRSGRDALCAALVQHRRARRSRRRDVQVGGGGGRGHARARLVPLRDPRRDDPRGAPAGRHGARSSSRISALRRDDRRVRLARARSIDEHPDESLFQFHLALAAIQRPDLLAEVRASYDGYIQTVREALERLGLGDDPALARVVFAAADGLSLQQLLFDNRAEIEDAVRSLQRLLRAVAARDADRG